MLNRTAHKAQKPNAETNQSISAQGRLGAIGSIFKKEQHKIDKHTHTGGGGYCQFFEPSE